MLLESADVVEAMAPDVFAVQFPRQLLTLQQLPMYAHGQHFLVMRTVEDANASTRRQPRPNAPKEIVFELLRARLLERMHLATLRVDAAQNVFDQAVLTGRIH